MRGERVGRERRILRGAFRFPIACPVLLVVGLLCGVRSATDAAYRLTFQNGTSVEVQGYDDVGDAIRYPRYGGTVTVPKAQVTAIHDVPPPLPPPSTLATSRPASSPGVVGPRGSAPRVGQTGPDVPLFPASPATPLRPAPTATRGPNVASGAAGLVSVAILVLVGAGSVVTYLRRVAKRATEEGALPYRRNGPLLSPAERSFYGVLAHAVDARYPIFAKVRLGDLLRVPGGTERSWVYRHRIDRKHVDFVLCGPDDLTPVLAIELDDASHERADRRDRDAFVDQALAAAELPILRVPARRGYAPGELRGLIEAKLAPQLAPDALEEVRL